MSRSPFFYVGDKYKLMPQLKLLFPNNIKCYYEPFVGGGSSLINTVAEKYYANDIDPYVIELHKFILSYAKKRDKFFELLFGVIDKYGLCCTFKGYKVDSELKKKYPKTYFAKINKEPYCKLKSDYNRSHETILLYVLLIYGFNHMIRFNSSNLFNLPVGNVDFNNNVFKALNDYFDFVIGKRIVFINKDFSQFLKYRKFDKEDFIYFDPPYLISLSEYNSLWNEKKEKELYKLLDRLDKRGVRWGITNLVSHKGQTNEILKKWSKKYHVYIIKSNYISFNDNTIKTDSKEVYVTNYGKSNI